MKPMKVPEKTVTRLSIYLRCLEELEDGRRHVDLLARNAEGSGLNSAQVRKDLAYFGQFGVRGLGYYVAELRHNLERILGLKQDWEVALVGVGNLGSALIAVQGVPGARVQDRLGFRRRSGQGGRGSSAMCRSSELGKLVQSVRRKRVKIGMLAVPAAAAQSVADLLVEAGVTAILNFAPTQLTVPKESRCRTWTSRSC